MITPEIGKTYRLRHSGRNLTARCIAIDERAGYDSYLPGGGKRHQRGFTRYRFLNLATQREILIKSRVKIREEVAA